jgi:hypothetical protein
MAGTLPIPLTTLPTGVRVFGPAVVADADVRTVLVIDRTPAGGLNALTAATTLEILVEQSNDGGTTWFLLTDAVITGGLVGAPKGGGNATEATVWVSFEPGTGRRTRATLTTVNGPLVVQGSLTTS